MTRKIFALFLLCAMLISSGALADTLVAGGTPLGISMHTKGISVAGFSQIKTEKGSVSPAAEAGILEGDVITKLGADTVETAEDFAAAAKNLSGEKIAVTVSRDGKLKQFNVTPARDEDGVWKLGLWLRDGISGVGTLTFYDPVSGIYGALGHSISDDKSGAVLPLRDGRICDAEIVDVVPGKAGEPGELSGCTHEAQVLGDIQLNCVCGIFGTADLPDGEVMETGDMEKGKAVIRCTLDGEGVKEYEIEVQRIEHPDGGTVAVIHVTDPVLLEKTGGIVQGMSGSPIIQNGCLVGAVTHVFVNDPTSGYGIGIYDMISAAEQTEAAA